MAGPPQMTTLARKSPQHTQPEESNSREVAPAPNVHTLCFYISPYPCRGIFKEIIIFIHNPKLLF